MRTLFVVFLTFSGTMAEEPVDFSREVLPILSDKCFVCHGPDTNEDTGLRLDTSEGATGDRGGYRAVNTADPGASEILKRINDLDAPMPPADAERQLSQAEKEVLSRWIHQGGDYARHWAFVAPVKQSIGQTTDNPIDVFIRRGLESVGADFAEEAEPGVLARRLALTLTGLPPKANLLKSFVAAPSPEAEERLIDALLDSSRFGEHQARYWLDAVRYGDTHGLHLDNRRGIYPYRDWVVRAMNQNMPLDEFITWQLAGDLLPDPSMEQLIATGYVRMNPTTAEGGVLPEEFQAKNNFDRTENFGTVFLGMSLNCARCHTHKYDPILQQEYYQLLAFFNSTAEPPLDSNAYEFGPTIRVPGDQQAWEAWQKLLERRAQCVQTNSATVSERELSQDDRIKWDSASVQDRFALMSADDGAFIVSEAQSLAKEIAAAEESFTTTLIARDLPEPRETYVLNRGEYDLPVGDQLQPDVLSVLGGLPAGAPANRLGLAKWVTGREHPLASRVLVNRIWQRTFGLGLVRTPEDFGVQGQQATHPELLDWLAVELQDSGWDLKHMLRLMVTSRTFRQSSQHRAGLDDPENQLWGRGPGYRLDAEVIRDVGLWSSNLLDAQMGGEGVKPYQPAGMWKAMAHPGSNTKEYVPDSGKKVYRRSLYVYWKRTSPHPMMTLFDAPDRESSCVRRGRTSTPLQSLGLLNETQRVEMGRALAERLIRETDDDDTRIAHLFTLLACRDAADAERHACRELIDRMRARFSDSPDDAQLLLSTGSLPVDPKSELVEIAAWTQLAITALASDAAIMMY